MKGSSPHQRMIIGTVLVGAAVLALLWLLAISPKRSESASVRENVAAQEVRLAAAKTQLASYKAARADYPKHLRALKRFDRAVPSRGEIPALLRQLQQRANARESDLRLAALQPGSSAPGAGLTPGATAAVGGLSSLPFSFSYTGAYFDLVNVLKAARRAVTAKKGHLTIDGRLVTIEGLSFERPNPDSSLIKASVSGTAYIAADTATPPQASAAPAAASTQGGS